MENNPEIIKIIVEHKLEELQKIKLDELKKEEAKKIEELKKIAAINRMGM